MWLWLGTELMILLRLARPMLELPLGTGTDVAIESAQIVLIQGHLTSVVIAINLSRHTHKNNQAKSVLGIFL